MNSRLFLINLFFIGVIYVAKAQRPVHYQLTKIAETVQTPPKSVSEAFNICSANGKIDDDKPYASFYLGMQKILTELSLRTSKQVKLQQQTQQTSEDAMQDGFGSMSVSEQAAYLKKHPQLQQTTGVDASMMEFAAKMQDPAFQKKFDAMSNEEKAKLIKGYQKQSVPLNQKTHSQQGIKTVVEMSRLMDNFNEAYYKKGLAHFQENRFAKEKELDEKEKQLLVPVLEEKTKLSKRVGKGMTEKESQQLREVYAKEWSIRTTAFERKLKFYQSSVMELIAAFKMAAQPVDDFLLKINYGEQLNERSEAKELAQIAGYQEGLFKAIAAIQDIAKDITLRAAAFYKEKEDTEKGK